MIENTLEFIRQNIGPIVAFLSAAIAWIALKANHDWNRRNCALQFLVDWNAKTAQHRKAIEEKFPGLIDKDSKAEYTTELTQELARKIYASKPKKTSSGQPPTEGNDDYWQARFHLIELGNHMECIASAYLNGVADKKMIKTSLMSPMTRWHKIMINYISEVETHRGYKPWQPWDDVVAEWGEKSKENRKNTA